MDNLLHRIAQALITAPATAGIIIKITDQETITLLPEEDIKRGIYTLTLEQVRPLSLELLLDSLAQKLYYEDALQPMFFGTDRARLAEGAWEFKPGWTHFSNAVPQTREDYRRKAKLLYETHQETEQHGQE